MVVVVILLKGRMGGVWSQAQQGPISAHYLLSEWPWVPPSLNLTFLICKVGMTVHSSMEFMQELNKMQGAFHVWGVHYVTEGLDGTRGQSHP